MLKRIPFLNFVMGSSQSRESAVAIIKKWDLEPKDKLIFDRGVGGVTQYLQAVSKVKHTSSEEELSPIIPMVATRLKHEFQIVLIRQYESVMASNSTTELSLSSITDSTSYQFRYEDFVVYETPSAQVIQYLESIAETMKSCGNLEACIQVYKSVRRPFVETIFGRLRLEELKAGDARKLSVEQLEMKIQRWIVAAEVCMRKLFKEERNFAAKIFSGSTAEECFLHVAKDTAVKLFSFPESVALSHQPGDRLKLILILYRAVLSLVQDVKDLFKLESGEGLRRSVAATCTRLGDQVLRMLSDLEKSVLDAKTAVSNSDGGRVLKLTKDVFGYINVIVNHKKVLTELIVSRPPEIPQGVTLPDDLLGGQGQGRASLLSPLGLHLVLIIAVLQLNLEKKSKEYEDASLRHLFVMNNVHYIVHGIESSRDLKEMIGGDYLKKLKEAVERERTSYENSTCNGLLNCLKEEKQYITRCYSSRVSTTALRGSITKFDAVFERMKSLQSSWIVHDDRLREDVRGSLLRKLEPAYEGFLEKFKNHLESGEESTKCFQQVQRIDVKYSVQDLKNLVEKNLFSRHQPPSGDV